MTPPRFGHPHPARRRRRREHPDQLTLDQVLRVAMTATGTVLFVLPGGLDDRTPEPMARRVAA